MPRSRKREKGLTLVEVIVAVAIFVVAIPLLANLKSGKFPFLQDSAMAEFYEHSEPFHLHGKFALSDLIFDLQTS